MPSSLFYPFNITRPNDALITVKISNNFLIAATVKNTLVKFDLKKYSDFSEVEICRSTDDRVHNIFMDPKGRHIIISMQSGSNFYTTRSMKKVRPIHKAKDYLIDSVAWNKHNISDNTTQEILIGTNDGLIFETQLSTGDESRFLSSNVEQFWKQVPFDIFYCFLIVIINLLL
ncbi:unnamed protein product [Protopolystoma xenopodis]|uniref:Pep3/Vps18 beta-propeller domain-containing protein n=1 Tax=Protopolystoma xenopodis TaxID=117903 RepID=A0A3S5B395_9PLAT|nr:unnamed protein product [Protopolystoma xenopodis]